MAGEDIKPRTPQWGDSDEAGLTACTYGCIILQHSHWRHGVETFMMTSLYTLRLNMLCFLLESDML